MSGENNQSCLSIFCGSYIFIFLCFWLFMSFFGEYSYKGFAYNAGRAIVWPLALLQSNPEIDGSSDENFLNSYMEVMKSHKVEDKSYVNYWESLSYGVFYAYAKVDTSITIKDYKALFSVDFTGENIKHGEMMVKKLFESNREKDKKMVDELKKYLNGMDYYDIVKSKEKFKSDIEKVLISRKN